MRRGKFARQLIRGIFGQPQCTALDCSAEADVSVGLGGQVPRLDTGLR